MRGWRGEKAEWSGECAAFGCGVGVEIVVGNGRGRLVRRVGFGVGAVVVRCVFVDVFRLVVLEALGFWLVVLVS